MTKHTTITIATWAEATFGPAPSDARLVARANEEMSEGVKSYAEGLPLDKQAEEAADVTIVLCRLAAKHGVDLRILSADAAPDNGGLLLHWTEANVALASLMRAVTADKPADEVVALLLEVIIRLALVAHSCGEFLWEAVEAKMVINEARIWKQDGTGHGYHVRA